MANRPYSRMKNMKKETLKRIIFRFKVRLIICHWLAETTQITNGN